MITRQHAMAAWREAEIHSTANCEDRLTLQHQRAIVWRQTGPVQTFKHMPGYWVLPVKSNLGERTVITPANAHLYHVAAECPLLKP